MVKNNTVINYQSSHKHYSNILLQFFLIDNLQKNLKIIEKKFNVIIYNKGLDYEIHSSKQKNINDTIKLLDKLNSLLISKKQLNDDLLSDLLGVDIDLKKNKDLSIVTKLKDVIPKNYSQQLYVNSIDSYNIIFALGPAGTAKTYLAVAKAVEYFLHAKTQKIVISRPIVQTGESLGYLPGDMDEKVDPYIIPIKDALSEMLPVTYLESMSVNKQLEVAPIAFMRGRTFNNSFVILDEAQNATIGQLKMLLTRMGENSKLIITGDLSQTDLTSKSPSGLKACIEIVKNIEEIKIINFSSKDVVRSNLVHKIIVAFDRYDEKL